MPAKLAKTTKLVTYPIVQSRCQISLISATASYCLVLLANICLFDFWICLLTPVVVTLSVSQAIHLHSGVSGPGHSEEQRVRLDHMRVAGFKLAAGYQQSREGAWLSLAPCAGVWVQRNLLLPRRNLLYWTAHILDGMKDIWEELKVKETSGETFTPATVRCYTPSSSCDRLWPAALPEIQSSAHSRCPETASLRQNNEGIMKCFLRHDKRLDIKL